MWIGWDGLNIFIFINGVGVLIIFVMWYVFNKDNIFSFMNICCFEIMYLFFEIGSVVEIFVVNGVLGGWLMIYNYFILLSEYG